ncbi:hypothetical protein YC2023_069265 [Brassica napus]
MANLEPETVDFEPEEDDLMDEDGAAADLSPRAANPRLRSTIAGANDDSAQRKTKGRGFREEKDSDRQRRLSSRDFDSLGSDGGPGPQRLYIGLVDLMGYALIEYEKSEEAQKAIKAMNGAELLTQNVSVDWAFSNGPNAGSYRRRNMSMIKNTYVQVRVVFAALFRVKIVYVWEVTTFKKPEKTFLIVSFGFQSCLHISLYL